MPLRQADVLEAAVALLEEVGLDELTTRKLADRLGVRVGALYWHYPSKQALLDAIAEQIITSLDVPDEGDWETQLRGFAHALRRAMLARRDGARLVSTMNKVSPAMLEGFTAMIGILHAAGTSPDSAAAAVDLVTSFVNGYTLEEQSRKVGRVPAKVLDRGFSTELEILLAGIRVSLAL